MAMYSYRADSRDILNEGDFGQLWRTWKFANTFPLAFHLVCNYRQIILLWRKKRGTETAE